MQGNSPSKEPAALVAERKLARTDTPGYLTVSETLAWVTSRRSDGVLNLKRDKRWRT
jgi:hypothetical protein